MFNDAFKSLQLKKSIKPPEMPSKHVRNWVPKVLEQRRQGLELYLQVRWHAITPPSRQDQYSLSRLPVYKAEMHGQQTAHQREFHALLFTCVAFCALCNLLLFCQTIIMENGVLPKIFLDFLNIRHFPSVPKTESCGWVETDVFLGNKRPICGCFFPTLIYGRVCWKALWLHALLFPL